jgi:hypothetical protein
MAIIAAAVIVLGIAAALASAVRLVRIGARDSRDLAAKLAIPFPRCAADWPELRLDAVVPDPDRAKRVLLLARWPAYPERRTLLVLDVDAGASRAHRLLMHWRDLDASLAPDLLAGNRLLLRRRRTHDTVIAIVVRETGFAGHF